MEGLILDHQPETITVDIHDFDLGIIFQVFSQFSDIDIHASTIKISVATPYFFSTPVLSEAGRLDVQPAS